MSKTPLNSLMLRAVTEAAMKQFTEVDSAGMREQIRAACEDATTTLYSRLNEPGVQTAFELLDPFGVSRQYTHAFLAVNHNYEIVFPSGMDISTRARKYANYGAAPSPVLIKFPQPVFAPLEWTHSDDWGRYASRIYDKEERRKYMQDHEHAISVHYILDHTMTSKGTPRYSPELIAALKTKLATVALAQSTYNEWLQGKVERLLLITKTAKSLEDVLTAWPAGEQYRELFLQAARI